MDTSNLAKHEEKVQGQTHNLLHLLVLINYEIKCFFLMAISQKRISFLTRFCRVQLCDRLSEYEILSSEKQN